MAFPRYTIRTDWLFYLFLVSYGYLVITMTVNLWFGDGVNIFASYSDATSMSEWILDANKVYWSKTSFLFSILLLTGLNVDFRLASGIGAVFWSTSLIYNFGLNPTLAGAAIIGALLVVQQLWRRQIFGNRT